MSIIRIPDNFNVIYLNIRNIHSELYWLFFIRYGITHIFLIFTLSPHVLGICFGLIHQSLY